MNACRYDKTASDYLTPDGDPCRHDDYGDPTHHCTARLTCAVHIGPDDLTCPRCLARARADLRQIPTLAALMPEEAEETGVTSEAANLAGPAADPEAWTWRKVAARQGRTWHLSLVEDDDEHHPLLVLGRWDMMLREDYDHPTTARVTVTAAADYLDRVLHRVAQDPHQDFALLARELRKCRNHLENVLRDSQTPERGAPCPECTNERNGVGPRLVRTYGHWCEDPDCEQFHYSTVLDGHTGEERPDTSGDWWMCPRDPGHVWAHDAYQRWIEERRAVNA